MPISTYNRYFGGKRGAAKETLAAFIAEYGKAKGTRLFYAKANKNKRLADAMKGR